MMVLSLIELPMSAIFDKSNKFTLKAIQINLLRNSLVLGVDVWVQVSSSRPVVPLTRHHGVRHSLQKQPRHARRK